jgi:hypothetical protein
MTDLHERVHYRFRDKVLQVCAFRQSDLAEAGPKFVLKANARFVVTNGDGSLSNLRHSISY